MFEDMFVMYNDQLDILMSSFIFYMYHLSAKRLFSQDPLSQIFWITQYNTINWIIPLLMGFHILSCLSVCGVVPVSHSRQVDF